MSNFSRLSLIKTKFNLANQYDTICVWNSHMCIKGIIIDYGCDTDDDDIKCDYEWIRLLVNTQIKKIINYEESYPYTEVQQPTIDSIEVERFTVKYVRIVLIEKNIVETYYDGLDVHIEELSNSFT